VPLHQASAEATLPANGTPVSVELDPDYHLFRKVPLDHIVPTTAATRRGDAFSCVLPAGDVHEQYKMMQSIFESSFEDGERTAVVAGEIKDGALAERSVLILGSAVHDPYISAFLSAIEFPLQWIDGGFKVDGVEYTDPGDAVLCTARHPGVPGGGVTVVFANSDNAIPRANIIPMYSHSLVIFKDGRRVLRRDFEPRSVVQVDGS